MNWTSSWINKRCFCSRFFYQYYLAMFLAIDRLCNFNLDCLLVTPYKKNAGKVVRSLKALSKIQVIRMKPRLGASPVLLQQVIGLAEFCSQIGSMQCDKCNSGSDISGNARMSLFLTFSLASLLSCVNSRVRTTSSMTYSKPRLIRVFANTG